MTAEQQKYIQILENEIGQLKDRLVDALGNEGSVDLDLVRIRVTDLLTFDLVPGDRPDTFLFKAALPIGSAAVLVSREEVLELCFDVANVSKTLFAKVTNSDN